MNPAKTIPLIVALASMSCDASSTGASSESANTENTRHRALVIAHRGASGYLPEHTIAAKAMAYAQGADYVEQDLVMTRDGRLVVLHDRYLDTVTDVADVYPERKRDDGRYYVIDFSLDEIRRLAVSERFQTQDGVVTAVFSERFPLDKSSFRVHTFEEEIELIQGLNKTTGRTVGIYPEIKSPAFHRDEGQDIATEALAVLERYAYRQASDAVFLQCFDADELQRIHDELLPARNMSIRLVQLIDTSDAHRWMLDKEGIEKVATYASGIGPSIRLLVDPDSTLPNIRPTPLVADAHDAGLQVHPYTFRRERDQMPPFSTDYNDFLRLFIDEIGVDGVFTDFPDLTANYIESTQ